jgi:glycosyltransferase involved in cell wall biosynthesis
MTMSREVDFYADLILVCNSLDAGGIERVVSTLANEWSRRGRKVSVVTLHDRKRFYTLDPEVHHVVVEQEGAPWLPRLLKKLRGRLMELRRLKPFLLAVLGPKVYYQLSDRVYRTHSRIYLAFESFGLRRALTRIESPVVVAFGTSINVITLKACRGMGRRVIISERNNPARLIQFWEQLWQKYYPKADLVTANTQDGLRALQDFVGREKLALVPNPLELPNGNGNHQASSSPLILTVGRLVDDKAQDVLLDAFALTGDRFGDWRLAIVGEGQLDSTLRKQAEKLGIAKRVDWLGLVKDLPALYRAATVFALPSRVEGTPNALLEAMSFGLPVVVSDGAPGLLEVVEHEVTGLVVPVNDAAKLADALRRLGEDAELRRRLGAAARERVREYDLPRALQTWESIVGLRCESVAQEI